MENAKTLGLIFAVFNPIAVAFFGFSELRKDNDVQNEKITNLTNSILELKQDVRDINIFLVDKTRIVRQ